MGYSTDFLGCFKCTPALSSAQCDYLLAFAEKRHMRRHYRKQQALQKKHKSSYLVQNLDDPLRIAVGLPVGQYGMYFTGGTGFGGQDNHPSIADYNLAPPQCPGLWCHWQPNFTGEYIGWNGNEKFNSYYQWLIFIVEHFLKRWEVQLNGVVRWQGESKKDTGAIAVKDNVVRTLEGATCRPTHRFVMPQRSTIDYPAPLSPITTIRQLRG